MKILFSTVLATAAAFASIASAAPTLVPRAEEITELPARFALYVASDLPWANGQRLRWSYQLSILPWLPPLSPNEDAYFLGHNGTISLDPSKHSIDTAEGSWDLMIYSGLRQLQIASEQWQAVIKSWDAGEAYEFVTGRFVQTSSGMLRLVRPGGVLQTAVKMCGGQNVNGVSLGPVLLWWDNFPYMNCPDVQFRVKAL